MNLGDEGMRVVMDGILQLGSLEELFLKISKNQELTEMVMKQFLQALNEMDNLKKVEISAFLCEKIYDFPKMQDILSKVANKTLNQ